MSRRYVSSDLRRALPRTTCSAFDRYRGDASATLRPGIGLLDVAAS